MSKKIIIAIFVSLSLLVSGCGKKDASYERLNTAANSSSTTTSTNSTTGTNSNTNTDVNSESTNNSQQSASTTPAKASTTGYSKYTGTWVTKSNLINDFEYGMVVGITVDKNGNLKGQVSDSTENLTHISNVDIKGKIQNNQLSYKFTDDGWGHNGTIRLIFGDNKIIITIKYGPNSSKDNFWGIGEGTFTLIDKNTKVTRTLANLKAGGLKVIDNQCFPVKLENYGNVKFISGLKREDANVIAKFYLVDNKGIVLYKFPDYYGNSNGMFIGIRAISFTDVNHDGLKDIIIITNFKTNTSSSSIIASIYFQKGKTFVNNKSFDDKMNSSNNNKDVATVIKYAKTNLK